MTPEDIQRMFGHLLPGSVTVVQMRRRSWQERLFSLPWRPMVATEEATTDNPLGNVSLPPEVVEFFEQQRQAPRRADIHVPVCPHCAVKGMVELWSHRHGRYLSAPMRRIAIMAALANVVEDYSTPAPEPVSGEH